MELHSEREALSAFNLGAHATVYKDKCIWILILFFRFSVVGAKRVPNLAPSGRIFFLTSHFLSLT